MKRVARAPHLFLLIASVSGCALGDFAGDESAWRDAIVANPTSEAGCFHAAYPEMTWEPVACTGASAAAATQTIRPDVTGDGNDYVLQSATPIFAATGSFVAAENVTSETSGGSATSYLLSLDTNLLGHTGLCTSADAGSGCFAWTEFLYQAFADGAGLFVYDTLIGYGSGSACPGSAADGSTWLSDGVGDCFLQSAAAIAVPTVAVNDLAGIKLGSRAVANSNDTLVFATGSDAFTTSASDSFTGLSGAWNAAEFNIWGEGSDGANFNPGARLRLRVGVDDGGSAAPTCAGSAGEIVFTNNLTLGACEALGGSEPSIEFTESD